MSVNASRASAGHGRTTVAYAHDRSVPARIAPMPPVYSAARIVSSMPGKANWNPDSNSRLGTTR